MSEPHNDVQSLCLLIRLCDFMFPLQPLDLCSRSLILSEEMILHESKHHSLKVRAISALMVSI